MNSKDKITFKKHTSFLLALLVMACSVFLMSCTKEETLSVKKTDDIIVISISEDQLSDDDNISLLDYMNKLKDRGELDFTLDDGMVTSMNGIKNSDKYWMLYTSDAENSNPAWGSVEYEGEAYSSASLGAKELLLKSDNIYLWVYKAVN